VPPDHVRVSQLHNAIVVVAIRALFDGGGLGGLNPTAKISDPLLLLKKRKGGRLSMYLCISTVVDFNSQKLRPP